MSDNNKCLTCEHWGGNSSVFRGNFAPFRQATGRCFCNGNPHYYNSDTMSANDGCDYWKKHPQVESEHDRKAREEREQREYERRECEREERERRIAEERKRIEQAIENYTEELRINPNSASAYYNRGMAYKEQGNHSDLLKDLEQAVSLEPENNDYREALEKEHERRRGEEEEKHRKERVKQKVAEFRQELELRKKQTRVIRCIIGGIIGVFLGLVSMGFSSGPYDRESIVFEIIGGFLALVCIVSGVIIGKTADSAGKGARMGAIVFAIIFLIAILFGNPRAFISVTGAGAAMGAIGGAIMGALGGRIIGSGK